MKHTSLLPMVLCGALLLLLPFPLLGAAPSQVRIHAPAGAEASVGDVTVTWDNGTREALTRGAHCRDAKLGPGGLIGWTWAKERYEGLWVNEHLRLQRGKRRLFDVTAGKPFIEAWAFAEEGLVVKSRAMHGPAWIELFSLTTGKLLQLIKEAYGDDLPAWARPFAE